MTASGSDGGVDIFRPNELSRMYDLAQHQASQIEQYEDKIVKEYTALDLYKSKGLSMSKITFNDLSLQENLNYVKFNLKNTHEAFKMFEITKEKFGNRPELAAQIVQKFATRSNVTHKNFDEKLFARYEYKAMLRLVKDNFA